MIGAVEFGLIFEVIWVSLIAGIGATVLFSLVVFGSSRAAEARRTGSNPTLYAALATAGMAAFMGIVVLAILVILNK